MMGFMALLVIETVFTLLMYNVSEAINVCCAITFIIITQENNYHRQIAAMKKENIANQMASLKCTNKMIYVAPDDFDGIFGYWTIIPLFERIVSVPNWNWAFFMEDTTLVDVKKLCQLVSKYDFKQDAFLGYSLKDEQPTIIHHFDSADDSNALKYPHFTAGFLLSHTSIKRAAMSWKKKHESGFSIDAKYELAKFLFQDGVPLKHNKHFCLARKPHCATWLLDSPQICDDTISKEEIFFAVKTCEKYHKDRIKVVKGTWGNEAKLISFFSDVQDSEIPTINLGIQNVESGHCEKTLAIFKYVSNLQIPLKWLVIADDDTLISVSQLLQLLSCYNPLELVAFGEKYGYKTTSPQGYDYITGGGGMVFSMPLVKKIASSCVCPLINSPDDMILGMCLREMVVPIVHSHYFHQARPEDYSADYINFHRQVSFHKHWLTDPYYVYKTYLMMQSQNTSTHTEL